MASLRMTMLEVSRRRSWRSE